MGSETIRKEIEEGINMKNEDRLKAKNVEKTILKATKGIDRELVMFACNRISRNISNKRKLEHDINKAKAELAEMERKAK